MKNFLGSLPYLQIIEYSIIGIILLLIFNIIGKYIVPQIEKRTKSAYSIWQRFQIIFWVIFSILFFSELLRYYPAITLIFTIVVLSIGWEYWKNVFAGVLIKFTEQFKEGDYISTDFIKGTLVKVYISRSELINEKGESVLIPNSKLRNSVMTHLQKVSEVNVKIFTLETPKNYSSNEVKHFVYLCPFISANQEIQIEKKEANKFLIKATIIDNSFVENVDGYLKKI